MYRGIARLLGMDVLGRPADLAEQLEILRQHWNDYDYFFLHHKYTDSAGEDGDRARKIAAIEQLDAVVPELRALSPDVIAVSGDHSTPSQMAAHSWHPVPTLLWSERCGRDDVEQFGEQWCRQGALGLRPTKDLMAFMLANAGRLAKYGAYARRARVSAGQMFWLWRKRLSGSHSALSACRRAYFFSPNDDSTRCRPSSPM